jgi:murein DD-endopeptidase MepM/ murein hydrolase activator NlpD
MAALRLLRALAMLMLIQLGTSAALIQVNRAAARAEPLIPDSATGAGADWEPWPEAVLPPLPARPVGPMPTPAPTMAAPTTLEPAPPRPDRPELVPRVVPVGDLALQDQTPAFDDAGPQPLKPLHYPLAVGATEQDPWGWRFSTTRGVWRMHTGLDLIVPSGTAVLAVLPGRVQRVDEINGYGLTVLINHGAGWSSLYAHLLKAAVVPGEIVGAGQHLGLVGQSGNASTPHLHLELRQRQPQGLVAVDPTPLLPDPRPGSTIAGDIRP